MFGGPSVNLRRFSFRPVGVFDLNRRYNFMEVVAYNGSLWVVDKKVGAKGVLPDESDSYNPLVRPR